MTLCRPSRKGSLVDVINLSISGFGSKLLYGPNVISFDISKALLRDRGEAMSAVQSQSGWPDIAMFFGVPGQ